TPSAATTVVAATCRFRAIMPTLPFDAIAGTPTNADICRLMFATTIFWAETAYGRVIWLSTHWARRRRPTACRRGGKRGDHLQVSGCPHFQARERHLCHTNAQINGRSPDTGMCRRDRDSFTHGLSRHVVARATLAVNRHSFGLTQPFPKG